MKIPRLYETSIRNRKRYINHYYYHEVARRMSINIAVNTTMTLRIKRYKRLLLNERTTLRRQLTPHRMNGRLLDSAHLPPHLPKRGLYAPRPRQRTELCSLPKINDSNVRRRTIRSYTMNAITCYLRQLQIILPDLRKPTNRNLNVRSKTLRITRRLLILTRVLPSPIKMNPGLNNRRNVTHDLRGLVSIRCPRKTLPSHTMELCWRIRTQYLTHGLNRMTMMILNGRLLRNLLPIFLGLINRSLITRHLTSTGRVKSVKPRIMTTTLLRVYKGRSAPHLSTDLMTVCLGIHRNNTNVIPNGISGRLQMNLPRLRRYLATRLITLGTTPQLRQLYLVNLSCNNLPCT